VDERKAKKVVTLIKKGVNAAHPFFESIAADAVSKSKVNLVNKSAFLFNRFRFFVEQYEKVLEEVKQKQGEKIVEVKDPLCQCK
jgi:hypothetical protein